jgi:GntR family transcriptional regulator
MDGPVYQKIYADLMARIRDGELPPDSRLDGEGALAERYGVARMTVRQALARLEEESLVVRQRGVGTFVSGKIMNRRSLNRLASFTEDMREAGRSASTEVLLQGVVTPSREIAEHLTLDDGAQAIFLKRLRRTDGKPILLHHSYLPHDAVPQLAHCPLEDGSLYLTLERVCGVRLKRADQQVRAAAAEGEAAELLKVPLGSPVLFIERISVDNHNKPIEYARTWARPELELTVRLER